MLHFKIPSRLARGLAIHHKWFAAKPVLADALRFAQYFHCQCTKPVLGFRRRPKFTILIDIALPEEAILAAFSETTRYEVKRAMRENLLMALETDIERFCSFHNAAADSKGQGHLDPTGLMLYWGDMYVTKVIAGTDTLAMHSYLFDAQVGTAALYHSASPFRVEPESAKRNFIGRANRWLHFQDMLFFKGLGAVTYDFGGYAKDTDNAELRRINEFKGGFGGSVVEESNYVSNPIVWWNALKGRPVTT